MTTSKDTRDEGTDTGSGEVPETPEVTTSKPTENSTDNGTATDTPDVTSSEPTEISTVNGTAPGPTEMTPSVSPGKVYPATILVRASYSDNLQNVNSTEYQYLLNNVSEFFKKAFKNLTGYKETVIVKIQPPSKSRSSGSLKVAVTNLFTENSTENETTVRSAVNRAIENNDQPFVSSYEVEKHCDIYPCDPKTTVCVEVKQLPECKCKSDLEKKEGDKYSCSVCSKSCSRAKHKYCIQEEDGPVCSCMINFKKEAEKCVACSVGFSGEECTDNSELILIIVGTVFGAIILSLVIAISVISVRAKHKQKPEKRSLMKSGYSDMNTSDDRPSMFPRVQTTSGHANPGYQPNNPYEMRSTNRDHFAERDYDDLEIVFTDPACNVPSWGHKEVKVNNEAEAVGEFPVSARLKWFSWRATGRRRAAQSKESTLLTKVLKTGTFSPLSGNFARDLSGAKPSWLYLMTF
ncbi:mucin-13 [Lonchura striata]